MKGRDSIEDINKALEQMGEPPLDPKHDVVQTRFVEEKVPVDVPDAAAAAGVDEDGEGKAIQLLEPPGYKRCELVFSNGRGLLIDMQYEDLVAEVRAFLADPSRDFLELPDIQVLGGDREGNGGVVAAVPMSFSRRALEGVQSMARAWAKRVPGYEQDGGKGKVAIIRGDQAKQVLVHLNNGQRRQLERQRN